MRASGPPHEAILDALRERGSIPREQLAEAAGLVEGDAMASALGRLIERGDVAVEDGVVAPVEPKPERRPHQRRGPRAAELIERGDLGAGRAGADPQVIALRSRMLGGELLGREQVPAWIAGRSARGERVELLRLDGQGEVVGRDMPVVGFAVPGDEWAHYVPSTAELEPLRLLSERLAREHGWQVAQATTFILTGTVPLNGWRVVVTHPGSGEPRVSVEGSLSDDPEAAAEAVRVARKAHGIGRKRKPDDERRLRELRAFVAEHGHDADAWRRWNEPLPARDPDRYSDRRAFKRAAERAVAASTP